MGLEHWLYKLPLRLRSLFRQSRVEQELRQEFEYHLERKIEYLRSRGTSPEEARISPCAPCREWSSRKKNAAKLAE